MKTLLKLLFKLNLLHLPNLGALIYPEVSKHQAGAKLRNKVKEINGNRLTDNDWDLILSALKGNGKKKKTKIFNSNNLLNSWLFSNVW